MGLFGVQMHVCACSSLRVAVILGHDEHVVGVDVHVGMYLYYDGCHILTGYSQWLE